MATNKNQDVNQGSSPRANRSANVNEGQGRDFKTMEDDDLESEIPQTQRSNRSQEQPQQGAGRSRQPSRGNQSQSDMGQ